MNNIKKLFLKYKSVISYLFFGICTTIVNVAFYNLCYYLLKIPNVPSTIIAWFLAVIFAFITNKLWVFDSKSFNLVILRHEIITFFGARILTGLLDIAIMFIAVDILLLNPMIWKIISNILVIILNYIASKLIIFKKK